MPVRDVQALQLKLRAKMISDLKFNYDILLFDFLEQKNCFWPQTGRLGRFCSFFTFTHILWNPDNLEEVRINIFWEICRLLH